MKSLSGKCASDLFYTVFLVCFYYTFAIGLTFYNKWMFKSFHYPLTTSSIHFMVVFIISGLLRMCRKHTPYLPWGVYMKNVFIVGLASALDIGLSNWSFVFITVSLYTMVKSTAIIFILGFAILFKLEKPRLSLVFVILLISLGLFMFVYKSSQFNLEGFLLVLSASFLGGIRWTMSQILTQKQELGLSNPIDLLYHLQPSMFIGLVPLAMSFEGTDFFSLHKVLNYDRFLDMLPVVTLIGIGALLAFMLSFSEYLLLTHTSSLTLAISGIFKEVCILVMATTINGDQLTPLNWGGFFMCISGICVHVYLKFRRKGSGDDDEKTVNRDTIKMTLLETKMGSDSESEAEIFSYR